MATKSRVKSPLSNFLWAVTNAGAKLFGIEVVPNVDIYIRISTGCDLTGDGSKAKPYRTHVKAFDVAVAGQTVYAYRGIYAEKQMKIKDGVNYIGGGASLDGTVLTCALRTNQYEGDPINNAWMGFISTTDTRETLGNNFSHVYFLGGPPDARIFVCNRDNFVLTDFEARNFDVSFITFSARRDYGSVSPGTAHTSTVQGVSASRTFPYMVGTKLLRFKIDNCAKWNGGDSLGSNGAGYASGSVQRGGQNGLELGHGIIYNDTRGKYQEGYCVKLWQNGHNMNEHFHHLKVRREKHDQYFAFAFECWGSYGGCLIEHCEVDGEIDLNNGAKQMAVNPTSTYSTRVQYCTIGSDDIDKPRKYKYDAGGNVLVADLGQSTGVVLEAISTASNFWLGNDELADVEIEHNVFKNLMQAYYYFLHSNTSAVRRVKFRNNLLINSGRGYSNNVNGTQYTAIIDDVDDSHNTSYNTSPNVGDGYTMGFACQVSNVSLKNNVHVGFTGRSPVRIEVSRTGGTLTNFSQSGNLYFNCGNGNVVSNAGGGAATGITESNLTPANPNFVDAANGNFNLTTNITGVDAGVDVDYLGNTRHATTPTVGAFEKV